MAEHARLKNEFTEDEKYHNLMSWLIHVSLISNEASEVGGMKVEDLQRKPPAHLQTECGYLASS